MLPTIVTVQAEADLHKGTPLGPTGLANQVQACFLWRVIGLFGIALDAGANNVLPRCRPAAVARDDMVQVQVLAFEDDAAILAGVFVPLKDVVPRELDLFLGQTIVNQKENDPWNANTK